MTTITERVAAGVALMDENDPEWWKAGVERAIDLNVLSLSATDLCVLGQRCPLEVLAKRVEVDVDELSGIDFGEAYDAYVRHLSGLSGIELTLWAASRGFAAVNGDSARWDELTAEWKSVIWERREAAGAAG